MSDHPSESMQSPQSGSSSQPREREASSYDRSQPPPSSSSRPWGNDRTKVWVGNLNTESRTNEQDLRQHFAKFFPVRVDVKGVYAFVECEEERDAADAIRLLDGTQMGDRRLSVRPPGPPKHLREQYGGYPPRGGYSGPPRGGYGGDRSGYNRYSEEERYRGGDSRPAGIAYGYRVEIENMAEKTSWQDLKDFGRRAGESVKYSDIFNLENGQKSGVISYALKEEADRAVEMLNGQTLDGNVIRCFPDRGTYPARPPPRHLTGGPAGPSGFRGGFGGARYSGPPPSHFTGSYNNYGGPSSSYRSSGDSRRRSVSPPPRDRSRSRSPRGAPKRDERDDGRDFAGRDVRDPRDLRDPRDFGGRSGGFDRYPPRGGQDVRNDPRDSRDPRDAPPPPPNSYPTRDSYYRGGEPSVGRDSYPPPSAREMNGPNERRSGRSRSRSPQRGGYQQDNGQTQGGATYANYERRERERSPRR